MEWTNYLGIPDEHELLVIRDRFTGIIQAFPLPGKSPDDTIPCFKRFIGPRKVVLAYSDQAPQFVKALRKEGDQLTCRKEHIQFLVNATATCLLDTRLPACYWTFAVACVSHLLNIEELEDGSAWQKMYKEKFIKGPISVVDTPLHIWTNHIRR